MEIPLRHDAYGVTVSASGGPTGWGKEDPSSLVVDSGAPQTIKCLSFSSINKMTLRQFMANISMRGILRRLESTKILFAPPLIRWRTSERFLRPDNRLGAP